MALAQVWAGGNERGAVVMNRAFGFAAASLLAGASVAVLGAGPAGAEEVVTCTPTAPLPSVPGATIQYCTAVDDGGSMGPSYGYVDKFRYICHDGSCATYPAGPND